MDTNEDCIPMLLSAEERENPYLLLEKLFTIYSLPELRELARKHLRIVLSVKRRQKLQPLDILLFYENIEKLFEATHMLKLRYDSLVVTKPALNETKSMPSDAKL